MLASVYSYRVMVKSVSSCCVRGRWVLSDPVTFVFCKAFDCVPHPYIWFKLKAYDISGNVLDWIMDFLSNSRQGVNGSCSDRSNNISGVPQGSVLGPLLFIVYNGL